MKNIYKIFFSILILTFVTISFGCDNIIDSLKVAFPPPGKTTTDDIQEDSSIDTENSEENNNENGTTEKPTDDEMGNSGTNGDNTGNEETDKPSIEDSNQGNSSEEENIPTDKEDIRTIETYPYTSTVNLTILGLDNESYQIEPKFIDIQSSIDEIVYIKRAFILEENTYTIGIDEKETVLIIFDIVNIDTKELISICEVELQQNQNIQKTIEIIELNTTITISGDYDKYENPKLIFMHYPQYDNFVHKIPYKITSTNMNITSKWRKDYSTPYVILINDTDNDNDYKNLHFYRKHNNDDYVISQLVQGTRESNDSTNFTANLEVINSEKLLPTLLDETQFIDSIVCMNYDQSNEESKYYRFEKKDNTCKFIIPAGTDSDGEFITCYSCKNNLEGHSGDHLWNLLQLIGIKDSTNFKLAMTNQTTELHSYIKQIITYLQDERGLTVHNIPDFLQD